MKNKIVQYTPEQVSEINMDNFNAKNLQDLLQADSWRYLTGEEKKYFKEAGMRIEVKPTKKGINVVYKA